MILKFTKMHGAGNDFVVIDLISQRCKLRPRDFRKIADRRFGVGCDQILLVEPPGSPEVDFRYRIFNADGGEVEQCGNGARCFARFVRDKRLTSKKTIAVETAGVHYCAQDSRQPRCGGGHGRAGIRAGADSVQSRSAGR